MSILRVDEIVDENGSGRPNFVNGIQVKSDIINGIATQAEAEAGVVNDKVMTPLRVSQYTATISGGKVLFVLQDQKTLNTNAQNIGSANSWITRELNTEFYKILSSVSLASNEFTPATDCIIEWYAPCHDSSSQSRCWNVTDSEIVAMSTSSFNQDKTFGFAVLESGKTYRIEQNFNTTGTRAGLASNRYGSLHEVYKTVIGRSI